MYPEWRGGYYYAAKVKADTTAPLGLLYVSRWASPDAAAEFAAIYAASLKERYKKTDGGPKDADSDSEMLLRGRHAWSTEEGTVVVEEQGDTVFVSESLDAATTAALEKEVFGAR